MTVVLDILGYVTDDAELQIEPVGDLAVALIQLRPSREPTVWWPPAASLDARGGLAGLQAARLRGVATCLLTNGCQATATSNGGGPRHVLVLGGEAAGHVASRQCRFVARGQRI
jgi:hypothetical protein